jgi:hypothetical protein
MSRLNLQPLMTFPDGSYLAISTECSKEGHFSCSVYTVLEGGGSHSLPQYCQPLLLSIQLPDGSRTGL